MKSFPSVQYLLFSLYELDAEDYGDVFLDIAEAFMESGQYPHHTALSGADRLIAATCRQYCAYSIMTHSAWELLEGGGEGEGEGRGGGGEGRGEEEWGREGEGRGRGREGRGGEGEEWGGEGSGRGGTLVHPGAFALPPNLSAPCLLLQSCMLVHNHCCPF